MNVVGGMLQSMSVLMAGDDALDGAITRPQACIHRHFLELEQGG